MASNREALNKSCPLPRASLYLKLVKTMTGLLSSFCRLDNGIPETVLASDLQRLCLEQTSQSCGTTAEVGWVRRETVSVSHWTFSKQGQGLHSGHPSLCHAKQQLPKASLLSPSCGRESFITSPPVKASPRMSRRSCKDTSYALTLSLLFHLWPPQSMFNNLEVAFRPYIAHADNVLHKDADGYARAAVSRHTQQLPDIEQINPS